MKYSKKKVQQICALIKKDTYTIAEICASVGISERCYYYWQDNVAEFAESIARAKDQFDETLVKEAKNSLRKLVNGYEVEEKKTVFVNSTIIDEITGHPKNKPKIKEQVTTIKHVQPNPSSVEYVLNNKASAEFKNRNTTELTGKDGKDLIPARVLTKQEAQEYLKSIEDEC